MSGWPTLVQLVPRARRAAYEAAGWTLDDDLTNNHHGRWSVMMSRPGRPGDTPEAKAAEFARLNGEGQRTGIGDQGSDETERAAE